MTKSSKSVEAEQVPIAIDGITSVQAEKIFNDARYIFMQSRLNDVRRKARDIALTVEKEFDLKVASSAEFWTV